MIGLEDAPYCYEYQDYFKILPAINEWYNDVKRVKKGKKVPPNFTYSSEKNDSWLSENDMKLLIKSYIKNHNL